MSVKRRSKRRILLRVLAAIAIALAVLVLMLAEWSPAAGALFRGAATSVGRHFPGLSVHLRRAGLRGVADTFAVSDLHCKTADFAEVNLGKFTVRYRLAPLFRGKGSLREITLRDLVVRVDATEPLPAFLRAQPSSSTNGLSRFDMARPPDVSVTNAVITVRFAAATSAPPTTVVITNASLAIGRGAPQGTLPYPFELRGAMCVDGGRTAAFVCHGSARSETLGPDTADFDVAFSLNKLRLSDFNGALSSAAPFTVDAGEIDCSFSARCREGRLAGLVSIVASDLVLRANDKGSSAFMNLSLGTWQFLVRDRKGVVRVDCPIGGTLRQPVVPVSKVLGEQAGAAGRKIGAGVLNTVSIGFLHGVGDSWEKSAEDRDRYDDILKIDRLEPREQHFERARHFEKIVKNYPTAAEEYEAQAEKFPAETNLAVRSLIALADVKTQKLADPKGAVAALRVLVDAYTMHPDADDAMLKMIDILIEQKQYPDANNLCIEFGGKFQRSGLAAQVEERRTKIAKFVW